MKLLKRGKLITIARDVKKPYHRRILNYFSYGAEEVVLLLYTIFIDICDIIKENTISWTQPPHMLHYFWNDKL